MTIKYLVTGREGVRNFDYSASSAITKTYGFKKIEDICNEMFDEVDDENRGEMILEEFNSELIRVDIDGEEDWEDSDYQETYDEAGNWNCVDLILKIDFKSETITTIYTGSWDND
mgnify:CR=1 FL=1